MKTHPGKTHLNILTNGNHNLSKETEQLKRASLEEYEGEYRGPRKMRRTHCLFLMNDVCKLMFPVSREYVSTF